MELKLDTDIIINNKSIVNLLDENSKDEFNENESVELTGTFSIISDDRISDVKFLSRIENGDNIGPIIFQEAISRKQLVMLRNFIDAHLENHPAPSVI